MYNSVCVGMHTCGMYVCMHTHDIEQTLSQIGVKINFSQMVSTIAFFLGGGGGGGREGGLKKF